MCHERGQKPRSSIEAMSSSAAGFRDDQEHKTCLASTSWRDPAGRMVDDTDGEATRDRPALPHRGCVMSAGNQVGRGVRPSATVPPRRIEFSCCRISFGATGGSCRCSAARTGGCGRRPDIRGGRSDGLKPQAPQNRGTVSGSIHLQIPHTPGHSKRGPSGHQHPINPPAPPLRQRRSAPQ